MAMPIQNPAKNREPHPKNLARARHEVRPKDAALKNLAVTEVTEERISPATAAEYLRQNGVNRRVRRSVVTLYAGMMKKGLWGASNDMICFDARGRLLNGQHRLLAVVESGTTQSFVVRRGVDPEAFKHMDTGAQRGVDDVLGILGWEYGPLSASTAKRLAFYAKAGYLNAAIAQGHNSQPGRALYADRFDILEVAAEYGPMMASVKFTGVRRRDLKKIGITPAQMAFTHALFSPWHAGFEDFAGRLLKRDFRSADDPANALLDRMLLHLTSAVSSPSRLHPTAVFGYIVLAANADFKGRGLTKLQWPRGSGFPQPLVQVAERITTALAWAPPRGQPGDDS